MTGTIRRTIKYLQIQGESEQLTPKPFVKSLPFHPATVSCSADRKAGKRVISSIYVQQHGVKQLKTNTEFFVKIEKFTQNPMKMRKIPLQEEWVFSNPNIT